MSVNLTRTRAQIDSLAREILGHIPEYIWKSDTTTFFDPDIAGGQLVGAVEQKLRDFGHSDNNIASRVSGFSTNKLGLVYAINTHKLVGEYVVRDFLKEDFEMKKFDVVIGNPPYQGVGSDNGQKLWPSFISLSYECLKNEGIMALVSPIGWARPQRNVAIGRYKNMSDIMYGNTIIHKNMNVNQHFSVGVHIGWFLLQKDNKPHTKKYYALTPFQEGLLEKVVENERFGKIELLSQKDTIWTQTEPCIKTDEADDTYNIPVIGSRGEKFYKRDDISIRSKRKIHIPLSFGYSFIKDDGKFAIGGQCEVYVLKETDTFDGVLSFFNSNLIQYILKRNQWIPQTNYALVELLPNIGFDRVWTDQELYDLFDISNEEIEIIERHFK